jgi:hypothetical protein
MKRINKVLEFKENVPQNVKNALTKIGDKTIVTARLGRTPVQAIIQGALKTVANVPYDDLFHLFIELTLDNGQVWVLEKIERINLVKENRSKKSGAEFTSSFPVNKTVNELKDIHFKLKDTKGTIKVVGKDFVDVKKEGLAQGTLFIEINQALLEADKMEIEIEVYSGDKLIETATTNFMGPRTF